MKKFILLIVFLFFNTVLGDNINEEIDNLRSDIKTLESDLNSIRHFVPENVKTQNYLRCYLFCLKISMNYSQIINGSKIFQCHKHRCRWDSELAEKYKNLSTRYVNFEYNIDKYQALYRRLQAKRKRLNQLINPKNQSDDIIKKDDFIIIQLPPVEELLLELDDNKLIVANKEKLLKTNSKSNLKKIRSIVTFCDGRKKTWNMTSPLYLDFEAEGISLIKRYKNCPHDLKIYNLEKQDIKKINNNKHVIAYDVSNLKVINNDFIFPAYSIKVYFGKCYYCCEPTTNTDGGNIKICPKCVATAVKNPREIKKIFNAIRGNLAKWYGFEKKQDVYLNICSLSEIKAHSSDSKSHVLGYTIPKDGEFNISIPNNMPRKRLIDTIVHELTHVHIRRIKSPVDKMREEGFCELVASLYNEKIGNGELNKEKEVASDKVYGAGYRFMKEKYLKNGRNLNRTMKFVQ